MCRICMQKDHLRTLKILQATSEFGGLWKHQNNLACTKLGVRAFIRLKLDTIKKKLKKIKLEEEKNDPTQCWVHVYVIGLSHVCSQFGSVLASIYT